MNSEPESKTSAELFRNYAFGNLMDKGRMSFVYSLINKRSRRTVAAKCIKIDGVEKAEAVRNEIHVLNNLGRHRNIIEFIGCYDIYHHTVIVTNLYNCGTLREKVCRRADVVADSCAVGYVRQICAGLLYLHRHKIVHGGLNIDNLVFQNNKHVRIIGFGRSRHLDRACNIISDAINSTDVFVSPEARSGKPLTYSDDMWSLGIVVYWMLTMVYPNFKNDYQFVYSDYTRHKIQKPARYFIDCLLYHDPQLRLTSQMALKHVWLKPQRSSRSTE